MEKAHRKPKFLFSFLKLTLGLVIILVLIVLILSLVFAIYIEKKIDKTVDESLFTPIESASSTQVYYYDFEDRENRIGTPVEIASKSLYSTYKCKSVKYNDLPNDLINAFIAIEDKRFFEHSGVDFKRTIAAGFNYFLKFNGNFGGSTITQQLIKNVTENDEYSFQRKLQEIFWALDLEKKFDKKEIFLMYLNIINLSDGCYGVGAAAEYYFSKDVSELSLSECACIAAITNNPSRYNPIRKPENNKTRRDLILSEMYTQGYISEGEYMSAINSPIELNINNNQDTSSVNSWYLDMTINDVINDLQSKYGYSRAMASIMIYTGGLKIYTAMDKDIQNTLEAYYLESNHFPTSQSENKLQSAMIVIDPKTGDILGVAGAIGKKEGNRVQNFATDTLRPAGSVIKPLSVYAPALEAGIIDYATVYDDIPIKFNGNTKKSSPWPKNANGVYRGLTNINYAISHSINTISIKVLSDVGLDNSFNFLYNTLNMKSLISEARTDAGIITDKDYAALALGQFNYGVTLREITAAYSIFANNGIYNDYRSYIKVTDSEGNIILSKPYHGETVLSEENATIMTYMLKDVLKSGTAKDISLKNKLDVAGKTGTTQNGNDKWFIGYTPSYICGIWLGYEYPKALDEYTSKYCNRVWNDVMGILSQKHITSGKNKKFDLSSNVVTATYCADSGKLMTEACAADPRGSRAETGYFIRGKEPSSYCDVHRLVTYDNIYGGVACPDCPEFDTVSVGLLNVKRSFPKQIYVSDAQYVWRDIGGSLPTTAPTLPFFAGILKHGEYAGISYGTAQYNRYCTEHFSFYAWKEKERSDR